MRFLFISAAGGELTGYSPIEKNRSFIQCARDENREAFFYWVLPTPGVHGWPKYDKAEMEHKLARGYDRVKFMYVPMLTSSLNGVVMATMDLYDILNIQKTMVFYDAVMNGWIPFSPVIKHVLKTKFEMMSVDVPIFNWSTRVLNDDRERMAAYNQYGESVVVADILGYLTDYSMFNLEHEKKLALEVARKYLSFPMVKRLMETSTIGNPVGIRTDELDKVYGERKRSHTDEVTMYFGGRWTAMKRFDDVLNITSKIFQSGRKVKGICSTPEMKTEEELDALKTKHPFCEFHAKTSKVDFFKKLVQGDFFICLSTTDSFGTAYWEMLYMGLVGVFIDAPFIREVLPPGYPFIAKNEEEVAAMVCMLVDMLATEDGRMQVEKLISEARKRLKERNDSIEGNRKIYEWTKNKTDEHWNKHFRLKGGLHTLIGTVTEQLWSEGGDGFTFSSVMERMSKLSESGREFGRKGDQINRFVLRRMILNNGYVDMCEQDEPTFRKKKDT